MSGQQLLDSLHQRARSRRVIQRQVLIEPGQIEVPGNLRVLQDSLHLGAEVDLPAAGAKIERLDAHTVACQNQAPLPFLPQGQTEHALKFLKTSVTQPKKKPNNNPG